MTTENKTYISDTAEVSASSPLEIKILEGLGKVADTGWVTCDDGAINVRINDGIEIPLETNDTLLFRKEDNWRLKRLRMTTTSVASLTVRYLFYNTKTVER